MMLGPREEKKEDRAFGEEEELVPYCKVQYTVNIFFKNLKIFSCQFCFAKKFKVSLLSIQETVQTMPGWDTDTKSVSL